MVRLPENLHLKYAEFQDSITHLTDSLNREPTDAEIAKHLGWSKGAVIKYKGSLYSDLTESGNERPSETSTYNQNAAFLEHLRTQLSREEIVIMDNVGNMSSTELANKIGVNVNRLNYLKNKLITKIKDYKAQLGEIS
jgi:DNA-directed RNA polymerase specialized sigma subunit